MEEEGDTVRTPRVRTQTGKAFIHSDGQTAHMSDGPGSHQALSGRLALWGRQGHKQDSEEDKGRGA